MSIAKAMLVILFTMILTENYVLMRFLGICAFLGVSKKLDSAVGMSVAVILVMGIASAVTYTIDSALLVPLKLEYLRTVVFILVIASLVQVVEFVLKKFIPALHRSLGIYLPLITTNCAVLGVTLLNLTKTSFVTGEAGYTFWEAVASGVGGGLGFLVAMVLFVGVRRSLERAKPPKCFEGLPITLIAASLTSLTFTGFAGIVQNLFNV